MAAYYNEIDPYAAQWLRNLIAAGHIAPGDVDERSIEDVTPQDLKGYKQCHFFAGIGVWSYALRLAGVNDDTPIWTGSCPCQPFSAAGKGGGFADERHLWPDFYYLIEQCRPAIVFGEQVASKAVAPWIDLVQTDLEVLGYAFGGVAFPAASVGAPHIRDRLFWVADSAGEGSFPGTYAGIHRGEEGARARGGELEQLDAACGMAHASKRERRRRPDDGSLLRDRPTRGRNESASDIERRGEFGGVADAEDSGQSRELLRTGTGLQADGTAQDGSANRVDNTVGEGLERYTRHDGTTGRQGSSGSITPPSILGGVAYPNGGDTSAEWEQRRGEQRRGEQRRGEQRQQQENGSAVRLVDSGRGTVKLERPGPTNGVWGNADWLRCRDGKWRPVESGTFPLVNGAPSRVGRLRAYGNAINAQAAKIFIEAVMECRP